MAIIYSYPLNTPKRDDLLIGTITYDEDAVNPVHGNPTVSFTVGSLLDLIAGQGVAQNLQQVTNIGNTTTNSIVISNNIKVSGGYYDSSNQPGTAGQLLSSTVTGTQWVNSTSQGVTSVGLTMPAAFTVANSPITQAGVLTVTGAGTAAQYINGLGNLITFPTIPTQYVLPVATTVALGGVKIGYTSAGKNYAVQLSSEKAFVNVPWTDTTYTLPAATNAALGGIKIGYTSSGKNYAVQLDADSEGFVNVPWTDTPYTLPLAADGTRGGVQIGYTQTATRDYPVTLASEKMLVTVPWTDTQNADQTIAGSGSNNTNSGITLSASGGTVLVLGAGSVTAEQNSNTITLTGVNTWIANAVTVAGYVAAPAATDANLVWKTDANGNPAWRADADAGAVSISTAVNTTGTWTTPLVSGTIDASRNIQLTSNVYGGGAKVGFVPTGGTSTLYLKGDGSWGAIPTGLQFKGTWDASGGSGGSPDLTLAANKGAGFLWICDVAGTAYPNGGTNQPSTWALGDWCVYDGSAWTRVPATNAGVTSVTTTDGTYVDLTPNTATTGAVTITADLSAVNGTSDTSTRFLSKDNTWDVPSYTGAGVTKFTNTNGTFVSAGTENTDATGAVTVGTIDLSATGLSGTPATAATQFLSGANTWSVPPGTYTLPLAANGTRGGVQIGYTTSAANRNYAIQLSSEKMFANVPWTDTQENTKWYVRDSGDDDKMVNNNKYLQFVTATGALGTNLTGTGTTSDPYLMTLTSPNTQNTYTAGAGLSLSSFEFSADIDTTAANSATNNLSTNAGKYYAVQLDNNSTAANRKMVVNVPWSSGGTYDWEIKDNQSTPSAGDVASGKTVKFVGATGALSTVLTDPNSDGNFIMTLTSPNTMGSGFTVSADTNTAATTITQGDTLTLSGGTNVATVSDPDGTITINATDTNTKYDLSSGTDTTLNLFENEVVATANADGNGSGINISYDNESPTGAIVNGQIITGAGIPSGTKVVSHTSTVLTLNQSVNVPDNAVFSFKNVDTVAFTAGSNITLTGTSNEIEIEANFDDTTYDLLAVQTGGSNVSPALRLDPSTGSNDDIVLTGSGGTTITRTSDTAITIDSDNDNDTYTLGSGNTKVITLTKTSVSPNVAAGTVTFADGAGITISGNSGTITIANNSPDSGLPAVLTSGANPGVTSLYTNTTAAAVRETIIAQKINYITVTVASYGGGNRYFLDGQRQIPAILKPGFTYRFDQSNSSNLNHPLRFSITSDGTHNSGVVYTTGVTVVGSLGTSGAYTQIITTQATPYLYYYCTNHSGMGGDVPLTFKSLTTTGTSGASTLTNGVLNIPNYADGNTTYSISIPGSTTKLRLTGVNPASTDDVEFVGGGITTVTRTNENKFTITSTEADTLATVTARAATTSTASTFSGGLTANPASNNSPAITTNSALGSIISLGRNALPTNGVRLGQFEFNGYNSSGGTNSVMSANIVARANVDWVNASDYSSEILFQTTVGVLLRSALTSKPGLLKVWGNGAVGGDGKLILNCYQNSHGQTLSAQPHSANVTNTMLLPKGANSTLVSEATETFQSLTTTGTSGAATLSGSGVLNIPQYSLTETDTLASVVARGDDTDASINVNTTTSASPFAPLLYLSMNASAGTGSGIVFRARSGAGGGAEYSPNRVQGNIYTTWTTVADPTRTSEMVFQTTNSGTTATKMTIAGDGDVTIHGSLNGGSVLNLNGGVAPNGTAQIISTSSGVGGETKKLTIANSHFAFDHGSGSFTTFIGNGNYEIDARGAIIGQNMYAQGSTAGITSGGSFVFGASTSEGVYINRPANTTEMNLYTGGNPRITIENNGQVGVNNTSPSATLHLTATASNGVPFKLQGHNSTTVEQMLMYTSKAAATNWYWIVAQANSVNQLIIYGNGDIKNKNNSYGQISDIRLKENIVDAKPKLEDIKKLKVKNFNLIGDDLKQIGLIAQEVEEVFPGLVNEDKEPDIEGGEEGGVYKSVKYSVLVPILIKAMQEQQEIIDNLKSRIEQLEN